MQKRTTRRIRAGTLCALVAVAFATLGNTAPTACVTVNAPPVAGDPGGGGGGGQEVVAPKPEIIPLKYRYSLKCSARPTGTWSNGFKHMNGNCYACPKEYPVRTMAKIGGPKACGNSIFKGRSRAKYYGPGKSCPNGDVTQRGSCYFCPGGSRFSPSHGGCLSRS